MTENQSSSSSSKEDLDLSLKRISVQLWILERCVNEDQLLLKQDGCLGCFNLEFDSVIGDLPFTDVELADVYMAGLKDEIAASLRPFMPTTLLEAKYLAHEEAEKVVEETQGPQPQESDGSSLSTQEVQEKALEGQEACGSSQEESFDNQEDKRATPIRGGCDCKETLLHKQHGSVAEFNLEFDLVTAHLTLTEDELVCLYIAGLKHEIAAPGRLLWPRTLLEAKHQARCHELLIEMKTPYSRGAVSPTFLHHGIQNLQQPQSPTSSSSSVHRFEELRIRNDNLIRKESARKKNLMNIKLSYSNDAIKQRLKELQDIKDNLIRENSARKKNLPTICEDCMKLSVIEKDTTSDESHSQGSDRSSQSSTDVTG